MDLAGGLRGLRTLDDGPRAALILAVGEEGDQSQQRIGTLNEPVQAGLFDAQLLKEHGAVVAVQLSNVLLELGANGQYLRALLCRQIGDELIIFVGVLVGKAVLVHVCGVDDGLEAEQIGGGDQLGVLLTVGFKGARALTGVEVRGECLEYVRLVQELLVALAHLRGLFHAAVHHLQVGHDEFEVDRFNVADGIDGHVRAGVGDDVHDVLVIEAAHDVNDGVRATDVLQELVAEASTLARALDKTRDVHEFDDRGGLLLGVVHLGELVQPLVGHGHHADVRLDGAERIVGALRAGVGDGVEQGGLADVRQPDDT